MPTSTAPWPATSAAAVRTRASASPSRTRPSRSPEQEHTMSYEQLMSRVGGARVQGASGLDRRSFLKRGAASGVASSGFARGLFAGQASAAEAGMPLKPSQTPAAFIPIDKAGPVTVMVNRLDFG